MPQPDVVVSATEDLIRLFETAQRRLEAEQARILTDPAQASRRRKLRGLLASIDRAMETLRADTTAWVTNTLPAIYATGANNAVSGFGWNSLHRQAINRLAADTFDDVLAATNHVSRDARRWAREVSRELAASQLLEGRTVREVAAEFARRAPSELFNTGMPLPVRAVVYADGSSRTLEDYADMLLRTKSAQTYNVGALNSYTQAGLTEVEVADGPGCKLDGHGPPGVDDINGETIDMATAFDHVIGHPRCVRAFLPVVPVP